ncbi:MULTISPECIES: hypothetical protein [Salinibacter]|mgnify:FL=1|uniref:Uncharacterized protein n=1 Tax=Salinibacter ruber TaxID=146919 RepID=A0A9X2V874_9BACT|nr:MULTISPECIES: hypothetical protein [Salinibacter]MBB4090961.1 hypothetical protein [Salinibacter ruber]MCS3639161.1 hypothetical protein [Salinibacter ruber]MCS3648353.1 hypothetical protein [Salinibacter ruber]MCS3658128.1 hypothetical protein [Salinibacter ruber]MCS3824031.1 hypothetical protein [Salinibacter ruber]
MLRKLTQSDVQNLLCRKSEKSNVIVRFAEQEEGEYLAIVREREGNEYLRSGD